MRTPNPGTEFVRNRIVDPRLGGLTAVTFAAPKGWRAGGNVEWQYGNVSWPVRVSARTEAPDGSAWLEAYPAEMFSWLRPVSLNVPIGAYSLGMIHHPDIGIQQALRRYVIARYRGRAKNLQIVGFRPIDNLAQALGQPATPGEAIGVRIRYLAGNEPVDEEFYALMSPPQTIPYQGPQGTTYEIHRMLSLVHSLGAKSGKLEQAHPLLEFVASSFKTDPVWQQQAQGVYQQLAAQFNNYIAQGYAQIQAAAQLSRSISANNDAMLSAMNNQRAVQAQSASASRASERVNDDFDQYIRGTQRMQDPYTGTSEQTSQSSYHWTDSYGSYRHSDDPTYDPNIGSSQAWQRMEPARP